MKQSMLNKYRTIDIGVQDILWQDELLQVRMVRKPTKNSIHIWWYVQEQRLWNTEKSNRRQKYIKEKQ